MKKLLLAAIVCLPLAACTYSDINFESMNPAELAAYNQGKPIGQMIVCSDQSRSFSRVRRRQCVTVERMYGSVEEAGRLGVLNSVQGYAAASGGTF